MRTRYQKGEYPSTGDQLHIETLLQAQTTTSEKLHFILLDEFAQAQNATNEKLHCILLDDFV